MSRPRLLALATTTALLALAAPSSAQSIIKTPGDHPDYKVEVEPKLDFGWAHLYANNGFGAGARFSIPIVRNGFVPSINNSVAITFGLDYLRYGGCYYGNGVGCGASYFLFPVAMQWNFWLTPRWSVFAEPGLYIYHGVFDGFCGNVRNQGCVEPSHTSIEPAFFAGGRFHFNDTVALTMRLGYPTLSLGVSFLF